MRKIVLEILGIIGFFAVGWGIYMLAHNIQCRGQQADDWAGQTFLRIEASNSDWASINDATTESAFALLSSRAEARYHEQENQVTPNCLAKLQGYTMDTFFYEWKILDALKSSDRELASSYIDKVEISNANMLREYDRLAAKYGWDAP